MDQSIFIISPGYIDPVSRRIFSNSSKVNP